MIDMQKMMQQAQQVQFKLQEMQEKIKDLIVDGQSGGGMVKVTMSCAGVVQSIVIDPAIINPDDKETLEDMIIAALNNANEAKDVRIQEETQRMMKELGMPPGTKLPF